MNKSATALLITTMIAISIGCGSSAEVEDLCPASPSPTASPDESPSPSPTGTSTPEETPVQTPSPTPTATPTPDTCYQGMWLWHSNKEPHTEGVWLCIPEEGREYHLEQHKQDFETFDRSNCLSCHN